MGKKIDFRNEMEATFCTVEEAIAEVANQSSTKALEAYLKANSSDPNVGTTIRLAPNIHAYYSTMADQMGISVQAMINLALNGLVQTQLSKSGE
ncbi:hypothetical protein A3715_29635 [Oleiphilus sp. HI0009]|nr:hypothetical protein A3715_11355 [Oleiphilus sp. HI0009]KZX84560.1 hypothetical protein A3715_29635 [Oleiphilus sp. HI0009]